MKVRDVIKLVQDDGWHLVRTRGSHRHFKHPQKPGLVSVAGYPSVDMPPGTFNSVLKQAGLKGQHAMRYTVVIEQGPTSYGAYVPDLPGCVAAAEGRAEIIALIREAIEFHLEGLREEGLPVPEPHSTIESVEVATA